MSYERQTGQAHPQTPEKVELPREMIPLWEDFSRLSATRSLGAERPNRISYNDIHVYRLETDTYLELWEIDALLAADSAYMSHVMNRLRRD